MNKAHAIIAMRNQQPTIDHFGNQSERWGVLIPGFVMLFILLFFPFHALNRFRFVWFKRFNPLSGLTRIKDWGGGKVDLQGERFKRFTGRICRCDAPDMCFQSVNWPRAAQIPGKYSPCLQGQL